MCRPDPYSSINPVTVQIVMGIITTGVSLYYLYKIAKKEDKAFNKLDEIEKLRKERSPINCLHENHITDEDIKKFDKQIELLEGATDDLKEALKYSIKIPNTSVNP